MRPQVFDNDVDFLGANGARHMVALGKVTTDVAGTVALLGGQAATYFTTSCHSVG